MGDTAAAGFASAFTSSFQEADRIRKDEEQRDVASRRRRFTLIALAGGAIAVLVVWIVSAWNSKRSSKGMVDSAGNTGSGSDEFVMEGGLVAVGAQKLGWTPDGKAYVFDVYRPPEGIKPPAGYSNYYAGRWYKDQPQQPIKPNIPAGFDTLVTKSESDYPAKPDGSKPFFVASMARGDTAPVEFSRGRFFNRCPRFVPLSEMSFYTVNPAAAWESYYKATDRGPDYCNRPETQPWSLSGRSPEYMRNDVGCSQWGTILDKSGKTTGKPIYQIEDGSTGVRCKRQDASLFKHSSQTGANLPPLLQHFGYSAGYKPTRDYWIGDDLRILTCPDGTESVQVKRGPLPQYKCLMPGCPEGSIPAYPWYDRCARIGVEADSIEIDIATIPGRPKPESE